MKPNNFNSSTNFYSNGLSRGELSLNVFTFSHQSI